MITVDRSIIESAVFDTDLSIDDLRDDYSGRGMYGDRCLGIVCDLPQLIDFVVAVTHREEELNIDWLSDVRSDGMGLSTIWYWPGVQLGEED